ncbi:MAG: hypothetical protein IPH13_11185 [Planctomycetes bacterium]|nr:hypothetical protein [Planctomycetota bacterium]
MIALLRARASGTVERDVRRDLVAEANAKAAALGIAAVLVAFAIAMPIKLAKAEHAIDPMSLVAFTALPLMLAVACSFVYRLEPGSRVPLLLIALVLAISTGPVGAVVIAAAVLPFVGTRAQRLFTPEYRRLQVEPNAPKPNVLRSPWSWGGFAYAGAQWWFIHVSQA